MYVRARYCSVTIGSLPVPGAKIMNRRRVKFSKRSAKSMLVTSSARLKMGIDAVSEPELETVDETLVVSEADGDSDALRDSDCDADRLALADVDSDALSVSDCDTDRLALEEVDCDALSVSDCDTDRLGLVDTDSDELRVSEADTDTEALLDCDNDVDIDRDALMDREAL
jgi:hypothetical protein